MTELKIKGLYFTIGLILSGLGSIFPTQSTLGDPYSGSGSVRNDAHIAYDDPTMVIQNCYSMAGDPIDCAIECSEDNLGTQYQYEEYLFYEKDIQSSSCFDDQGHNLDLYTTYNEDLNQYIGPGHVEKVPFTLHRTWYFYEVKTCQSRDSYLPGGDKHYYWDYSCHYMKTTRETTENTNLACIECDGNTPHITTGKIRSYGTPIVHESGNCPGTLLGGTELSNIPTFSSENESFELNNQDPLYAIFERLKNSDNRGIDHDDGTGSGYCDAH